MKELERLGIGRPSTYASIISMLTDRRYVMLEQRRFSPTPLGETVEKIMVLQFPDIFNVEVHRRRWSRSSTRWKRASSRGSACSRISGSRSPSRSMRRTSRSLSREAHDISKLPNERCPKCGGKLVAKGGFFGPYVMCVTVRPRATIRARSDATANPR